MYSVVFSEINVGEPLIVYFVCSAIFLYLVYGETVCGG